MGKASNRSTIERLIQRNREQEERNNILKQAVAAQAQVINTVKSDVRVEALRRRKATEAELRELALDAAFTVEEQHVQQTAKERELQDRMSSQWEKEQQEKRIAELKKHQICRESDEIRKLQEQLAAAVINRERAAQVLERQLRESDAAVMEARLDLEMEERRLAEREEGRRKELDRRLQLRRIGCDLVRQIEERQRARQEQRAGEYEREKEQVCARKKCCSQAFRQPPCWIPQAHVGEVVATLLKELDEEKRQLRERRQRHVDIFKEASKERALQKQLLHEQKIREENEIRDYLEMQRQRAEDIAREKELLRKEKARVLNELLQSQARKQKEQTDYAQLIADLYKHEREEQERMREEAQRQKREEERALLAIAFKQQMMEKERKRQAAMDEEARFRQELYAKFARDARLEQLTKQKRMMAISEHNRQVKAILQERRRQREQEREREKEEHNKLLEVEAAKQTIIQQERERLLREHAGLVDFLPKFTIHNNRERVILNSARQYGGKFPVQHIQTLPKTMQSSFAGEAAAQAVMRTEEHFVPSEGR
ncbi:hypothetical protein Efla_003744 [Eimeria flavescens]